METGNGKWKPENGSGKSHSIDLLQLPPADCSLLTAPPPTAPAQFTNKTMNQTTWEPFNGRQHRRTSTREARVTLGRQNVIYMNLVAHDAFGAPAAVEMLYDGNRRIIGLKPCDPQKRNASRIMPHAGGSYRRIQASAFCQHFRLKTRETLLFNPIDIDNEGTMTLGLNEALVVGRGAR